MYMKNETLVDKVSIFTGADIITKYGLIDPYNSMSHQTHWLTDTCNSLFASDGSIFPPHLTKNTTLYLYDKRFCRTLPLVVEQNPENTCYCPGGPPCAPSGLLDVSLCRYGSPTMLSFPHFHHADDGLRNAVDGISPPDPKKHTFYLDVQPDTGFVMSSKERIQFLAVSHVVDIKAVGTFPDIIFPIFWFEESINDLPEEITNFIANDVFPKRMTPLITGAFGE